MSPPPPITASTKPAINAKTARERNVKKLYSLKNCDQSIYAASVVLLAKVGMQTAY